MRECEAPNSHVKADSFQCVAHTSYTVLLGKLYYPEKVHAFL